MKPEEALKSMGLVDAVPIPPDCAIAISADERAALRIVLAMAKAAQAMAIECDNAAVYIAQGTTSAVTGPIARALAASRRASGGEAP